MHDLQDRRTETHSDYLNTNYEHRGDPFEIIKIDSPHLENILSRLRHEIFCEEKQYEIKKINKVENDLYDDNSESYLLFYKPLYMFVGGFRMIMPLKDGKYRALPATTTLNSPFQNQSHIDISRLSEVSRLLISSRQMIMIRKYEKEMITPSNLQLSPNYLLHLIKYMFISSMKNNLDGFLAMLRPALIKRIKKAPGMLMHLIGDPVEYTGRRQGIYVIIEDTLDFMRKENPKSYNFIVEDEIFIKKGFTQVSI